MSNVQEVLDTQKQIEACLSEKMAAFEKQLQSISSDSKPTLERLCKEFDEFKSTVLSLMTMLRSLVSSLTLKVDELDNQSRLSTLLFSGVQENEGEDCSATILDIINNKMGLSDVYATSFLYCRRLGAKTEKRNRPILVRFADYSCRGLVWREKKRLKASNVVLNEFLTRTRQELFTTARKHFGMSQCWSQDGQIYVKLPNNERNRIQTAYELDKLMLQFPTTIKGSEVSSMKPKGPRPAADAPALAASVPVPPGTRRNTAAKGKSNK